MRKEKDQAFQLRKNGKSYNEISKLLYIPKSTLSGWFKNDPHSVITKSLLSRPSNPRVAERIKKFTEANKAKWEKWREQARSEAIQDFPRLLSNPLFIAGTMLYWGEGDSKIKNPLRMANTDPRMVSLYIKYATSTLKIPKKDLRLALILYPDLSDESCKKFWSQRTGIPRNQFYKTQLIKGRHPTARLSHGICMVTYSSRQTKEKMLVWIDLLSKNL